MGSVASDLDKAAEAAALFEEGVAIARALGHTRDIALALAGLGRVAQAQGDLVRAAALLEESLSLLRELGDKIREADVLTALGRVRHAQGAAAGAAELYREGLAMYQAMGNRLGVAEGLEGLAVLGGEVEVAWTPARATRAARLLAAAAALRDALGAPRPLAERAGYERVVAAVRAALGDARFDEAWAAGRVLPLEQAIVAAIARS